MNWRGFSWKINARLQRRSARIIRIADALPLAIRKAVEGPIRSGIVAKNGCTLFRKFAMSEPSANRALSGDKTSVEGFVNHFHVEDLVDAPPRFREASYMACAFHAAERLAQELLKRPGARRFEVLVGGNAEGAHVRFVQIRPGEDRFWPDTGEDFADDCVATLEIGPSMKSPG